MAGFNMQSLQKAGQIGGGLLGVAGALKGAWDNAPRASKADRTPLYMMNQGFKPSDMEGLMAQFNHHQVGAHPISAKDLYDPSMSDAFNSMFGAGMGVYGATKGVTDNLQGTMGTTFIKGGNGFNTGNNKGWGEWGNRMEGFQNDENFMQQFYDQDGKFDQDAYDAFAGSYIFGPGRESQANPIVSGVEDSELPRFTFGKNGMMQACGGPLRHGCGGHLHAMGGMFDNGSMVGQAINMVGAGLGIGINAARMAEEKRKAEAEAGAYNFDLQFLRDKEAHDLDSATHDSKNNMFNMQAIQRRAHGGDLHTQGADFPMPGAYNYIGNGGTHEQNPNDGVPQGVATDGLENLVEQNEVVWNDYVFSHRLHIPGAIRNKYKLRDGLTFSEAAEKLIAEAKERPNDPISQNGIESKLSDLQMSQEDVRMRKAANKFRRQVGKMSPEELLHLQQFMQEQQGGLGDIEAAYAARGGYKHACGGHKFDGEGDSSQMTRYNGPKNRAYTAPDGKTYMVPQEWLDDLRRGVIYITNTNGKLGWKDIEESKHTTHRFDSKGNAIARRYRQKADGTMEELLGDFENDADFLDASGQLNLPRYDVEKSKEEVSALEASQTYKDTDALIKDVIRKNRAGEDLSAKEKAVLKHLQDVNTQFTRSNKQGPSIFNQDGSFADSAESVLFGDESKGIKGLRYDQKWGPNHWTVDQIYREPEQIGVTDNDWNFGEFKPREDEKQEEGMQKKDSAQLLPTWMRYAPLAAPFLADYTARDYSTMVAPRAATYRPIGDYLPYNPVDTQRYLTAIEQQNAARRGAIQNMSGANRNMAMAQDALAEYQRQQDIANALNTAEQINFDRRAKVGDLNRGTNMFNAQAFNQSELANMRIPEFMFHQAARNAAMRKSVEDAIDEAKGNNISSFLDTLHNIGRENTAFNMANTNPAFYYNLALNGALGYKQPIASQETKKSKEAESAACGGMLTKKQRKGRR